MKQVTEDLLENYKKWRAKQLALQETPRHSQPQVEGNQMPEIVFIDADDVIPSLDGEDHVTTQNKGGYTMCVNQGTGSRSLDDDQTNTAKN